MANRNDNHGSDSRSNPDPVRNHHPSSISAQTFRATLRRGVGLLAAASLLCGSLSGCANMSGSVGGVNLAVAAGDPCGAERNRFAQSQRFFTQEIVLTTVTGGLIGAGSGALIGAAAGGSRGALIGAATGLGVGLAAGLATGYWAKLQQNSSDSYALAQQVNGDVNTESVRMSETAASFSDLRMCRFAQARQIKYNARRGVQPRPDAEAQLAQEHAWFDQEISAATNAGLNMQKRDDQFVYAANQLPATATAAPAPPPTRASRTRSTPAAPAPSARTVATETIPQKRNSFETSVKTAQAQSSTAFSLDATSSLLELQLEFSHA